jgi:signal transduction histidine kinase
MSELRGSEGLSRLKWATILIPVAFVFAFEIVRLLVIEPMVDAQDAHLLSALVMASGVVVFATVVSYYLDRTQKALVAQNTDLNATHAVSSAVRSSLSLPDVLGPALERIVSETGALAGALTVPGPDGPMELRRPVELAPGLAWLGPLLDAPADPLQHGLAFSRRAEVDTGVLDLPLERGGERLGVLRLLFHPPTRPVISDEAFADIAGEIAGAVQLGLAVADLRRRERESAALYDVALQLTGRSDLRDTLEAISAHAQELLRADRVVLCLSDGRDGRDGRGPGRGGGSGSGVGGPRTAFASDGSVCSFGHPDGPIDHLRNPACPMAGVVPGTSVSRPLRSPEGLLGELCVIRAAGRFTLMERDLLAALADMAAIGIRTAHLREAEEQFTILSERDRIARELHDSLAQVLGVIHLRLRSLETRAADEASHPIAAELSDLADTADEAYRDVREAILGLRETIAEDTGLEGSLREYLRKYSRQTGIAASLACEGDVRAALPPRSEVQLLRVVQEALTNVRKHSGARRVVVRIDCAGSSPVLTVEDDGVGFDPAKVSATMEGGFGLTSMRERVEQIGGALDVHTAPGEGTRIEVRLPNEETSGSHPAPSAHPAGR